MPRCRAGTLAPGAALVHDEEQLGAGVVGAVQRDNVAVLHLREDGQLALDADVLRPRRRLVNHLPRWQPAPTPRQGVVSATWPGDQRYAGPSGATLSATLLPVALSRQSRTSEKAPLSPRADTATCGERRVFQRHDMRSACGPSEAVQAQEVADLVVGQEQPGSLIVAVEREWRRRHGAAASLPSAGACWRPASP